MYFTLPHLRRRGRLIHTDYSTVRLSLDFGRYGEPKPELQTQPRSRHLACDRENGVASIAWTWRLRLLWKHAV
jgi:hypothetical protein